MSQTNTRHCPKCGQQFEAPASYWSIYHAHLAVYCPSCQERLDRRFSDAMIETEGADND